MTIDEKTIGIVESLQVACATAFTTVVQALYAGMSEADIEAAYRHELTALGYPEHWYDVLTVLIGPRRFEIGTTTPNYDIKRPSLLVHLEEGQTVFIDAGPMDSATGIWGDWSSTCVFHPRTPIQREQVRFLEHMRRLHREGIARITAATTGAEVAQIYLDQFAREHVTLLDVRENVGHSMHAGPKRDAQRVWLDQSNHEPLGPGIFAVEPGGVRRTGGLVTRFEECILIPETGPAHIIGSKTLVPLET